MQLNIIAPLQKEISKTEGIQKISSQSKKGVGSITITFKGAMNEATTMVRVQNSASLVSAKLPKGVEVVLFKVKKEHPAFRK